MRISHRGPICDPHRGCLRPTAGTNWPHGGEESALGIDNALNGDLAHAGLQDNHLGPCEIEERQIDVSKSTHVAHEISISAGAFEHIIRAIAALSLEQTRFVTFKDVILYALQRYPALKEDHSVALETLLPLDGPVRIYVRLNSEDNAAVERLKGALNTETNAHCGVRETLFLCAMLVAEGEFSACKMQINRAKL